MDEDNLDSVGADQCLPVEFLVLRTVVSVWRGGGRGRAGGRGRVPQQLVVSLGQQLAVVVCHSL